jgi:hypothetical protein
VGNLSRAGVARSNVDFFYFRALSQLPDQGMLPGSAANNQYFYLPHPLNPPLLQRRGGGKSFEGAKPLQTTRLAKAALVPSTATLASALAKATPLDLAPLRIDLIWATRLSLSHRLNPASSSLDIHPLPSI